MNITLEDLLEQLVELGLLSISTNPETLESSTYTDLDNVAVIDGTDLFYLQFYTECKDKYLQMSEIVEENFSQYDNIIVYEKYGVAKVGY